MLQGGKTKVTPKMLRFRGSPSRILNDLEKVTPKRLTLRDKLPPENWRLPLLRNVGIWGLPFIFQPVNVKFKY